MALERGFRRIVIVLSVLWLGLAVMSDLMTISPHATVQVTLKDGRKFTVERHVGKEYLKDHSSLAYDLKEGRGEYKGGLKSPPATARALGSDKDFPPNPLPKGFIPDRPPPGWSPIPPLPDDVSSEDAANIVDVEYLRGPEYWWWTDIGATKFASGAVLGLWIAFYTLRWIARGFARQ